MKLTDKQVKVLLYIQHQTSLFKIVPSSRDIQGNFGWSSQTAAMNYLKRFVELGLIERYGYKNRYGRITPLGHEICSSNQPNLV